MDDLWLPLEVRNVAIATLLFACFAAITAAAGNVRRSLDPTARHLSNMLRAMCVSYVLAGFASLMAHNPVRLCLRLAGPLLTLAYVLRFLSYLRNGRPT